MFWPAKTKLFSQQYLVNLGAELRDRGVGLHVIEQGTNTGSPHPGDPALAGDLATDHRHRTFLPGQMACPQHLAHDRFHLDRQPRTTTPAG
jgi:hypothetical protein